MKRRVVVASGVMVVAGLVAGVAAAVSSTGATGARWRVVDLGSGLALPVGINDRGQVVGFSGYGAGAHAVLWQNGKITDLGTLGGSYAEPFAINDRGQVVGWSDTRSKQRHCFLWQNGKMTDLGTLNGLWCHPTAINDHGQVVGYTITSLGNLGTAFLWQNGKLTNLGTFGRGGTSQAVAINDHGQIVVDRFPPTAAPHGVAFLVQGGKAINLGSLGGGVTQARTINENGQVIGQSRATRSGPSRPFVWQNGTMTGLRSLAGYGPPFTTAVALNDRNQILGASGDHGILWTLTRN